MGNSDIRMVYVLLDGVGDLPHPDLDGATPLEAASTPHLDEMCRNGVLGEVVSVGRGIAPRVGHRRIQHAGVQVLARRPTRGGA